MKIYYILLLILGSLGLSQAQLKKFKSAESLNYSITSDKFLNSEEFHYSEKFRKSQIERQQEILVLPYNQRVNLLNYRENLRNQRVDFMRFILFKKSFFFNLSFLFDANNILIYSNYSSIKEKSVLSEKLLIYFNEN